MCNFGEYDVPFSIGEYNIVDAILNENCGDLAGWVLFLEWRLLYILSLFVNLQSLCLLSHIYDHFPTATC